MWGIIQKKDTHILDFDVSLEETLLPIDNLPVLMYTNQYTKSHTPQGSQ